MALVGVLWVDSDWPVALAITAALAVGGLFGLLAVLGNRPRSGTIRNLAIPPECLSR